MKLSTATTVELEKKYKTNLTNVMGQGDGGMPALSVMLDVAFNAAKEWNHGLKQTDMYHLFDKYIEEGGSQFSFYTDVYMDIFTVSGFYPKTIALEMQKGVEEVKNSI